jgi:hypothetical protein
MFAQFVQLMGGCWLESIRNRTLRLTETVAKKNMESTISVSQRLSFGKSKEIRKSTVFAVSLMS